jgi:hypothetical protein
MPLFHATLARLNPPFTYLLSNAIVANAAAATIAVIANVILKWCITEIY